MNGERHEGPRSGSVEFWEQHYQGRDHPPSGIPNAVLAGLVTPLETGTALDLGCGQGDDAIWLATLGWRVTAVDVSATVLQRVSARAAERGLASQVSVEQHDLARSFPDGAYDLVFAVYLESPVDFPRDRVLQRATQAVAPGGRLIVVAHGSVRPWAWNHDPNTSFPTPEESLAALELRPDRWDIEISGAPERPATGPNGEVAAVTDIVTAVRRRRNALAPAVAAC